MPAQVPGRYRPRRPGHGGQGPLGYVEDFYPLTAPGMPPPGPGLLEWAESLGDTGTEFTGKGKNRVLTACGNTLRDLMAEILHAHGDTVIPFPVRRGVTAYLDVVSGHRWGASARDLRGPAPAEVMVIGKNLGEDERVSGRNFIGPTGQKLEEACRALEVPGYQDWYVTNLVKTVHPLADSGKTDLSTKWIDEWKLFLHQELRLVQPSFILCLGADASKALLGKHASVAWMEGRVVEWEYPISREAGPNGEVQTKKALVMTILHPAAVLHYPAEQPRFENGVARFGQLLRGLRWDRDERDLDHRIIDSIDQLRDLYYETRADCEDNLMGVDAEWHGEHPQNKGAYVRSIQISWKDRAAACIALRAAGGKWRFQGKRKAVIHWLRRILAGRRLAMQFGNSDLEFLTAFGLDLREQYTVAGTWEETMEQAHAKVPLGAFDTGFAAHSVNEDGRNDLTSLTLRYTTAPRYDVALEEWKKTYCNKHKIKPKDMEGYGACPDDVLFGKPDPEVPGRVTNSYSCYDADVTRRMVAPLQRLLDADRFGHNCWENFWMKMRAAPAALEMNCEGVQIDRERLDRLTETYLSARSALEEKVRAWARWPAFNLGSVFQVREFLFGEQFNGKERAPGEPPVRLRPRGARSLRLEPLLTTDKRPMAWEEVVRRGLTDQKVPGTGRMILAILAQENQAVVRWSPKHGERRRFDFSEQVTWIRDYRFISKVLQSTLRVPEIDKATKDFIRDRAGYYVYAEGLPAAICDDGRIRTHLYLTKETDRWSSARPPMQNMTKRREKDYKRILGKQYLWPLRTIVVARPGHCLVEADYKGAELAGMAILSGDATMLDHVRRVMLPEDDPEYYDIHSQIAVLAFQLDCEPTKGGLALVGKKYLRDLAKTVIFGIAYGRGAKAIALAAKEEGVRISVEEAQRVVDTVFQTYPGLVPYFAECRSRALRERWLCGAFGTYRRFEATQDRSAQGDMERQAMNFPIQNLVADMVNRAVDHLRQVRRERPDIPFTMCLQIHDALLFEVAFQHVGAFIDEIVPTCMVDRVPIYPSHLDGRPQEGGPYYLDADVSPYLRWGEQMMPDACMRCGFDPRYAGWLPYEQGFVHPERLGKVWVGDQDGGELIELAGAA